MKKSPAEQRPSTDGSQKHDSEQPQAQEHYDDDSFWNKLNNYAKSAGEEVITTALKLYYTLQDKDTPKVAKTVIFGALVYFITPTDAVPDFLPGGYIDDLGALVGAAWTIAEHIKQEHCDKAKATVARWFSP